MPRQKSAFDWAKQPLAAQNQAVVDAYLQVGCPLEYLVYTPAFDRLCELLGFPGAANAKKNEIYCHLTRLSRAGRLPKLRNNAPPAAVD